MREIKFRAWDNVENKMHYCGEEIDMIFEVRDNRIECTDIRNVSPGGEGVESMEHLTYMQYTGLKDEDGTEIYEGDIVKCFANGNSYVSFKGGVFGLIFDYTFIPFSDIHGGMKVIGNVFQNGGLLSDS